MYRPQRTRGAVRRIPGPPALALPALRRRFESALSGYTELVEELFDDLRDVFSAIRQMRLSLTVDHRASST